MHKLKIVLKEPIGRHNEGIYEENRLSRLGALNFQLLIVNCQLVLPRAPVSASLIQGLCDETAQVGESERLLDYAGGV
jgi:hypothetical protein